MCGIVGYIGARSCIEILLNALKKLEFCGYDSDGTAVLRRQSDNSSLWNLLPEKYGEKMNFLYICQ